MPGRGGDAGGQHAHGRELLDPQDAVAQALHIPVKFIGVGEQIDDLMPFDAKSFAEALI